MYERNKEGNNKDYKRFMGAKEENGQLDIGWLHSTIWDFIDLVQKSENKNRYLLAAINNNKKKIKKPQHIFSQVSD